MKPERKQLLKKTKLSKAVKEINSLELQEKAENRYAKLLAENTLIHPVLEKHLRQSILPAVAVYEVILSAGFSKEIACVRSSKTNVKNISDCWKITVLFFATQKNVSFIS